MIYRGKDQELVGCNLGIGTLGFSIRKLLQGTKRISLMVCWMRMVGGWMEMSMWRSCYCSTMRGFLLVVVLQILKKFLKP